jgi:hypothetical protein
MPYQGCADSDHLTTLRWRPPSKAAVSLRGGGLFSVGVKPFAQIAKAIADAPLGQPYDGRSISGTYSAPKGWKRNANHCGGCVLGNDAVFDWDFKFCHVRLRCRAGCASVQIKTHRRTPGKG